MDVDDHVTIAIVYIIDYVGIHTWIKLRTSRTTKAIAFSNAYNRYRHVPILFAQIYPGLGCSPRSNPEANTLYELEKLEDRINRCPIINLLFKLHKEDVKSFQYLR